MALRIFLLIMAVLSASVSAEALSDPKLQESFWQIYTKALRGDKVAQFQVGVIYERGMGIERDPAKAAEWYDKSAWQGYIDAQYNLALMYATGRGVARNEERAMIWLAKAARQGDRESRRVLLEIIDGKLGLPNEGGISVTGPEAAKDEPIVPVTLTTKEGAKICSAEGKCSVCKTKTTLTSKSRRGKYYRISGMGGKEGWRAFDGEGWIDESSVEIRR